MHGLVLALVLVAPAACSSSDKETPPLWAPPEDAAALAESAADVALPEAPSDAPAVGDQQAPTDGGSDEEAAPPLCPPLDAAIDAAIDPPPTVSGVCLPSRVWSAPVAVAGPAQGASRFASVTPDELTIAWIDRSAAPATVMYADRDTAIAAFGTGTAIGPATGYMGDEGAALSPDGMRLVVVTASGKGFTEYVRNGRPGSFYAQPSDVQYQTINQTLGYELPAEEVLSAPVVAADDNHFYYSRHGGTTAETIYESTRSGPIPWTLGRAAGGASVQSFCGRGRRPTGISSDLLTIFYWDQASSSERAAWRASPTSPFTGGVDLGDRPDAQPSQGCTRIYVTLPSGDVGYEDG